MPYLGIDVGFSASVRSTGVCVITPGRSRSVSVRHVRTHETMATVGQLLAGRAPRAISFDGPLVPGPTSFAVVNRYRDCERLLSGGIFQKRCKPGPTNSPRGQALHRQTTSLANELVTLYPAATISEAFPNAFLGIMLPDKTFTRPIRRGIKSDVFWKVAVSESGLMKRVLTHLFGAAAPQIYRECRALEDHDERAAFVCAVTARAAHSGRSLVVHTRLDGSIALGPAHFTQRWALAHLRERAVLS